MKCHAPSSLAVAAALIYVKQGSGLVRLSGNRRNAGPLGEGNKSRQGPNLTNAEGPQASIPTMPQSGVRRRRRGRRSEFVEYGDELLVHRRCPITERLDWVRFSKSVETCEQANALTTGKFGLGRAPAEK